MDKIDTLNKVYNQVEYVKSLLEDGTKFYTNHNYKSDMRLIAIYLKNELNMKPKQREEFLYDYVSKYIENYNFILWFKSIDWALSQAKKPDSKLRIFTPIKIYREEFNYINSFDLEENHKRILFTLLCFYKYECNRIGGNKNNYYIPNYTLNPQKIKKPSGIKYRTEEAPYLIYDLEQIDLIGYSPRDGGQYIVNFIKDIPEIKNLEDFITVIFPDKAGLYFSFFLGDKRIKFCKKCGDIFRKRKDISTKEYCEDCTKPDIMNKKIIHCEDCDIEIVVSSKDNKTIRCKECQKIQDRENAMLRKRKQREREKLSRLQ